MRIPLFFPFIERRRLRSPNGTFQPNATGLEVNQIENRPSNVGVTPLKCGAQKLAIFWWFYDDIAA